MTDFQKGVAYTSWWHGEFSSAKSDATLAQIIRPLGINWISVVASCKQDSLRSTEIHCNRDSSAPTDEDIRHVIRSSHSLGLRVLLKPHVDVADPKQWRGQINLRDDETAWNAWFESYTKFITHYAAIAAETEADSFAIGTELGGTSRRSDQWRRVVSAVRAVYKGPLIYAANWDEAARVNWWDAVDAIGVDAYYPLLVPSSPTVDQLTAAWQPRVSHLAELAGKWNRPVIFTEIGYRSLEGAHRKPSDWGLAGAVNLQLQADCYEAVFKAFGGQSWWHGVYWWNWTADPAQGGPDSLDYTANNKPAEAVLRKYFGAQPRLSPTAALNQNSGSVQ